MVTGVDEQEQGVAPSDTDDGQPTETDPEGEADAKPSLSLEDLFKDPDQVAKILEAEPVKARISAEAQKAEDRARNRALAEQRRRYGNPEVVEGAILGILREAGIDSDSVTRSMKDRANNVYTSAVSAAAELFAQEIPRSFFANFKYEQEALDSYQEKVAANDFDGAFQALVDGAVSQKAAQLEQDFEKRVKAAAKEMAKQELEAANGEPSRPIPPTSRGSTPSNGSLAFTTKELERIPSSIWSRLKEEQKQTIYANVAREDERRGADTYDAGRVENLVSSVR